MKTIALIMLTFFTSFISNTKDYKVNSIYNCSIVVEESGRCTGSSYCSVCSNCSRCSHCSNGGSCGVCSSSSPNSFYSTPKRKKIKSTNTNYYSQPTKISKTYYVNESITIYSESINLREKPSTKSKIIEKLGYGDTIIFIEKTGDWSKVKVVETGTIGFVFSKLLNF